MPDHAAGLDGEPSARRLRLKLHGDARITRADGRAVALARKDAALLALLALEGPQAPQRLWALLWPDSTTKQAGNNLRQRATELRRDAGAAVVVLGPVVRLDSQIDTDVHLIAELTDDALCALPGLLHGVDVGDLDELNEWLAGARRRVDDGLCARLAERGRVLEREGQVHEAITLTRILADRRALDEEAWYRLMSLLYLSGNRSSALEAYWAFNTRVREEHGVAPGLEMQRLLQAIEAAEAMQGVVRPPLPVTLQHPPALIGRDAAWAAMAEAWQRQQAFLVVGGAGMGKSRLLQEFLRGQAGVHFDHAQPGEAGIPYALLGRVLVELDRVYRPSLTDLQRQELSRLRPEFGPRPETPAQPPVLWAAAEGLVAAAIANGLQALVLDDLHNADAASLEALRWLGSSRRLQALKLGLATRPEGTANPALSVWLEDSQRPVRVDLRTLTADELTQLLATLALPSLVDASLGDRLFRLAGGHPLYTLAALQSALAAGTDLKALDWSRPKGIEDLLDSRLRNLPAPALELAQVAAVAGADFGAELAAYVLDRPMMSFIAAWAALEAADVFCGRAFSHDLMHEAALRALPVGVAQALHRRIATWLQRELHPTAARVAAHWEAGERPAEAGRWWHLAGQAAQASGRLAEQVAMFESAAACHARAGDAVAQFESAFARLPALRLRHGGGAVLDALAEVGSLAETRAQRLRCDLTRAEALLDVERSREALAVTEVAVRDAELHLALRAEAHSLHADALAQCGDDIAAQVAAAAALEAATQTGDGRQRLRALNATRFVHYCAGRLADALHWAGLTVVQAEAVGERAEAAAAEGDYAALLSSVGDVPATYAHALACRARHADIGMAQASTMGAVNHIVLGSAAAALGRFDEALVSLQAAIALCDERAAAGARAKARLMLANVWLTLGRPDLACGEIESMPPGILPGMQMQSELVRARAALQVGGSPDRHFRELARLAEMHPDPPLVQSAWWEWSWAGNDPAPVIAKLEQVRAQCEGLGLVGTARSFRWRELARWMDVPGDAALSQVAAHARALEPHAVNGTSAKCHPVQTLTTLAGAFARVGESEAAERCRTRAFDWLDRAWPHVPQTHRASFLRSHVLHADWAQERAP